MKKLISILIVLLLCSSVIFAGDGDRINQFFAGFNYRFDADLFKSDAFKNKEILVGDVKAKFKDVFDKEGAITFGVASSTTGGTINLYNSFALTLPYYTTINNVINNPHGEAENVKDNIQSNQFYGIGFDWIIGPKYNLLDFGIAKVPLVIGGHVYSDLDWVHNIKDGVTIKALAGVGGMLGAEIYLASLNIFVQCQWAYDFYALCWDLSERSFDHGYSKGAFSFMPQIGIGLKY